MMPVKKYPTCPLNDRSPRGLYQLTLVVATRYLPVLVLSLFLSSAGVLSSDLASAQEASGALATLYSAEGGVEGTISPATDWSAVATGQAFQPLDRIRTLEQSRAGIKFASGYLVRMNEKTTIAFSAKDPGEKKGEGSVNIKKGVGYFFSRKKRTFPRIKTTQVSASVRGTEFVVEASDEKTVISVLNGSVIAENDLGSVTVGQGEQAITENGQAPVKQILLQPLDAVQWALYYPALLDFADFADWLPGASAEQSRGWETLQKGDYALARHILSGNNWREAMGRSLAWYLEGDRAKAIAAVSQVAGPQAAGLELYRAGLALSAGQTQAAQDSLLAADALLAQAPEQARPRLTAAILAQKAIIALVKNSSDEANALANEAIKQSDQSAAATLAMSYIAQSRFELEDAVGWLEKTIALQPTRSLPRARLAEMLLAFGKTDEASAEIADALALNRNDAYTRMVAGFVELTRYRTEAAREQFLKAIAADQSLALARLGLGLADIRDGELERGRTSIEQAVQLDPYVALLRSYLGKAFYEEEDNVAAAGEYQRAMELDPNDPTPYLYRSHLNLADHKPIEALTDLQESIKRNEYRAVFRSRLLLDQDVGTRSSSLGRIYSRIGFTELARVEAIKALNRDYSNYSAHFLLADLYRDTHLNSRAQTTENLLGRLLVPVNFNANDLSIGGAAALNEYTTLFDRPAERVNTHVGYDTQTETVAGRADYTKATNELGMNIGYAASDRQGFRDNDFARRHQVFSLGQYQLSEKDMLLWDAAYTVNDQGDVIVNFDPYAEDPDFESEFDGMLLRGGYHRTISPGTHILAQTFYSYGNFDVTDKSNGERLGFITITDAGIPVTTDPFSFDGKVDQDLDTRQHLTRSDLQLIWDRELVSVVTGVSGRYERLDSDESSVISDSGSEESLAFVEGFGLTSSDKIDQYSYRSFIYSTWHLLDTVDFDLGLVYSKISLSENALVPPFADDNYDKDRLDPKVGLTIAATPTTNLRMTYSKTLDRTGRGGIGPLEPTFVGGFNQVFDGVQGSVQEFYGIGVDQTITDGSYAGVNYQHRRLDLDLPFLEGGLSYDRIRDLLDSALRSGQISGNAKIDTIKAYYYQVLSNRFSATLDYTLENFDESNPFPESVTNRAAARLNYFHQSGFFAFSGTVYRYQERSGDFDPKETNDFWTLDTGIGYEFAKRQGAIALRFNNLTDESFNYSPVTDEGEVYPRFGAALDISYNF